MSRIAEDVELKQKLRNIAAEPPSAPDPSMITAVVESVLDSLSGDITVSNLKLYHELEQLARFIQSAKAEIAAIQPHDIREQHIPMATDELDAVVAATAEATGEILGAAEVIERSTSTMSPETSAVIAVEVTRIYEACNFQDITGQRITKVVNALKHIETKIDALLDAFGESIARAPAAPAPVAEEDKLVNGPQLPVNANNQDDIDAILASFD